MGVPWKGREGSAMDKGVGYLVPMVRSTTCHKGRGNGSTHICTRYGTHKDTHT